MSAPVIPAARGPKRSVAGRLRGIPRPDGLRLTLALWIVLDVSRFHQHYSFLAVFRPMLLIAAFALAYAFLRPKLLGDFKSWSRRWPARAVAALGVAACLSAVFGISLGGSASFILEDYVKVLIPAFLLMSTIRNVGDLRMYIWAYVVACAVLVWMSLFVFGMTREVAGGIYRLKSLYTYDANDICVVLLAGLGLCLFIFRTSGALGKTFAAAVVLGIGVTIAKSGSRGGFVGLMAFGAALLLMPAKTSLVRRVALVGAVAVGLFLGSPAGYWKQMQSILTPTQDYNWSDPTGRRMIAKRGMGYMLSYPLFGVGVNNFSRAEGTISSRAKEWRPNMRGIWWVAPHNSYVQVGAELGVPGLLLWSSLLIGGVVSCWRLRRTLRARWVTRDAEQTLLLSFSETLPLTLIGFGASAAFVSFAYLSPIYILVALLTGMLVSVEERSRREQSAPGPGFRGRAAPSPRGHGVPVAMRAPGGGRALL